MKPGTTGTLSGCVVWVIVFGMIGACLFPTAIFVGGFTSGSISAMKLLGPMLCPAGTTAEAYTYQTTINDEFGNPKTATATELHCVDENGMVVKSDEVGFAFLWIGAVLLIALILSAVLAFVFAAPAGVLISRMVAKLRRQKG